MRRILILFAITFALLSCASGAKPSAETAVPPTGEVEVIYFHGKKRCITCNAIEKLTKEVVDSLANDKIVMKVIDISQPENEPIADKYEVTWSSLILDRGGKVENLTKIGFGYAKNTPEIFKVKLIEAINKIRE